MDYLKQHNAASAPALLVIARYLASRAEGQSTSDLQKALHPTALKQEQRIPPQGRGGAAASLTASLAVGMELGLLEAHGATRDRRVWSLQDSMRARINAAAADSRTFRSLLLRCMGEKAMRDLDGGDRPSDVTLALTWLLRQDPLAPFPTVWGDGPEAAFRQAKADTLVNNPEQWRAFMRWARALGLAQLADRGGPKPHLLIDPTHALSDVLHAMPSQTPADHWFRRLYSILPILGEPRLIASLPSAGSSTADIPGSIAVAMLKLERIGRLRLVASSDARDAVVLRLGRREQRISEVHTMEGAA
ncbi:protein DpdG [Streptomyces variegatus]|uniref:protein DpdG n=1 Tax=Streptomyces variegatus TaxID=284040 RepID=UPI003C2B9C29